jgi:hypothetical protein
MNYLSVCAIFRDEKRYLAEWLEFHRLCGVEHFYLYDNESVDEPLEVLGPWIERGLVTYRPWAGVKVQTQAYLHCARTYKADNRWIAFIDIDEFLYVADRRPIPELLGTLEDAPGVGVNWVMFGTSGHETAPDPLVTVAYQLRGSSGIHFSEPGLAKPGHTGDKLADYYPLCTHIKSIIDPNRIENVRTPHSFRYLNEEPAIMSDGTPITGTLHDAFSPAFVGQPLTLNHYWSKSRAEFTAKLARGRADTGAPYHQRIAWYKEAFMNSKRDSRALPIAKQVEELEVRRGEFLRRER